MSARPMPRRWKSGCTPTESTPTCAHRFGASCFSSASPTITPSTSATTRWVAPWYDEKRASISSLVGDCSSDWTMPALARGDAGEIQCVDAVLRGSMNRGDVLDTVGTRGAFESGDLAGVDFAVGPGDCGERDEDVVFHGLSVLVRVISVAMAFRSFAI